VPQHLLAGDCSGCGSWVCVCVSQGAKMAVYCKCSTLRDGLFVAFAVVWVLTRMIFYPFWYATPRIVHVQIFIMAAR